MTKKSAQNICKRLQKRIQLGKTLYRFPDVINRKYFTMILKTIILTALVSSVTDTEEAATGGALKIQIKVPQNLRENTYARVSFLIKLQGPTPVNFVKFLRIPFRKGTVSQDMKAFKLQYTPVPLLGPSRARENLSHLANVPVNRKKKRFSLLFSTTNFINLTGKI